MIYTPLSMWECVCVQWYKILLNHKNKHEIMPFAATWMVDEPKDYHAKSSKSDRGRRISHDIHMCNLKLIQMNIFTNRNRFTDTEIKLMITKGERRDGMD